MKNLECLKDMSDSVAGPTFYNLSEAYQIYSRKHKMSYMIHQIEIGKIHIDSTITVEFTPMDENVKYGLLLDHERIPIPKKYEHAAIVSLKDNVFEREVTKMPDIAA